MMVSGGSPGCFLLSTITGDETDRRTDELWGQAIQ